MRFLYALVAALSLTITARADEFLVVVFDTSGSMGEHMRTAGQSRMTVAQNAMCEVLLKAPPTTHIGVLTFEGWIYDLQTVDKGKLEAAIRGTRPGGGTPLYEFIKKGGTRLLQERAKFNNVGSYKMLVVSDGQAQDDQLNRDGTWRDGTFKPGVIRDIISRGIVIDAIGLDMSEDHALKTQINGFYMRGDDPASIKQALTKAVAEVKFDGKDSGAEEFFAELAQMPEPFVKATITGLTEFQNHPIGERAPLKVMVDGKMVEQPHPDGVPAAGGGMGWGWWVLIVLGGIFIVVVIVIVINGGGRC